MNWLNEYLDFLEWRIDQLERRLLNHIDIEV